MVRRSGISVAAEGDLPRRVRRPVCRRQAAVDGEHRAWCSSSDNPHTLNNDNQNQNIIFGLFQTQETSAKTTSGRCGRCHLGK